LQENTSRQEGQDHSLEVFIVDAYTTVTHHVKVNVRINCFSPKPQWLLYGSFNSDMVLAHDADEHVRCSRFVDVDFEAPEYNVLFSRCACNGFFLRAVWAK
jgi:hypothetical protein